MSRPTGTRRDPFADLGLRPGPGVTDDEVRAAWRRIAAATHPDRADGGDQDRYAVAAAAYHELRTTFGRGEALAARTEAASGAGAIIACLPGRVARGRPLRLALRCAATAAVGWLALTAGAPRGAGPALVVGALTWLIVTARRDLAP